MSLADFACPGAARALWQVAALNEPQRVHEFRLEHVGAAAVIGKRRQPTQCRRIAGNRAEIGLEPPDRDDHGGGHAIGLLDLGKGRGVLLHQARAPAKAVGIYHAARELLETLSEDMLAMILRDDPWIIGDAIERADRRWRNAIGLGLSLEAREPCFETCRIAAGRGFHGRKPQEKQSNPKSV